MYRVARTPGSAADKLAGWTGTERYEVQRCIGSGAAGAVYEVFDRSRGQTVALKRLRHFSPSALYQLKREFRTLADVDHPNLVRLHELVATDGHDAFFTMELLRGLDFVGHVREGGAVDLDRLRHALRQLVEGVQALHAAGKLHGDIKPSNVLVATGGRVVLLDFGVATELLRVSSEGDPAQEQVVGTASYMAPEQARGDAPTPVSDWYSVGAILFEALVGSAPFVGSVADVLRMKSVVDVPPPSSCAQNVPQDLDALCDALLKRAPHLRPSGSEILHRLDGRRGPSASPRPANPPRNGAPGFVGREQELVALGQAFELARSGQAILVRISGASGAGKSALANHFLDDLARRGEAIVLRGRAYQRESVPYKAVDAWVDALSRHLLQLSDRGDPIAFPKDIWALARLFPVLRRVPEVCDARAETVADPHRLRRRAFAALRELLASLSRRAPVIVYVDDAQWGDGDSAALLLDLMQPGQAPRLLLLMTYSAEEAQLSPLLNEMRERWPTGAEAREVVVGALDVEAARRLALTLLGADDEVARVAAEAVARECLGSPFLVEELVRSHQMASGESPAGAITLRDLIDARLARLSERPRRLLEMIAVSGRPLPVSIVGGAAGVPEGADEAVASLRADRFVRTGLRDGQETVETCHQSIAEVIVAHLSAGAVRDHHRRLARAFEETPGADPEAVAAHLVGAGETARGAPHAERAAERAIDKLAFDRAVQFFKTALEGTPEGSEAAGRLRVRLAEALSLAGRGAEAGRVYLEAAEDAPGLRRVELEGAAAEQLMGSGRIDEGAAVLRRVLGAVGIRVPRSSLAALFWLAVFHAWAIFKGMRWTAPGVDATDPEDEARIEALYSAAMGFAIVDVLLGACMQARHLIVAFRRGGGFQVLRAALIEAGQLASLGGPESPRERALMHAAEGLAARSANAEWEALFEGMLGINLFLRGRWSEARKSLDASVAKLPRGRAQWQSNGQLFALRSLYFSGQIAELARRQARVCVDAQDRGDLYTTVNLATTNLITTHLVADHPEEARRHVNEAMAQWSQKGFFVQHWQAMAFEPDIDLYVGDGASAYRRFMKDMPALKKSLLLNVQFIRAITLYTLGRCAVASAGSDPTRRRARIVEARRAARRLDAERMPWTAPLAAIVRAVAENAAGDRTAAIAALRDAVARSDAADMAMHGAAARHRLGELLGGGSGRDLIRTARESMAAQDVRDPARWVAVYLPGLWGAATTSPAD